MTVIVDTGPLLAYLSRTDPHHQRALHLMDAAWRGTYGAVLSPDHVFAEGLTFLGRKHGRRAMSDAFAALFDRTRDGAPRVQMVLTEEEHLMEAARRHFQHYDARLSIPDCIVIGLAERSNGVVATFDKTLSSMAPTADT